MPLDDREAFLPGEVGDVLLRGDAQAAAVGAVFPVMERALQVVADQLREVRRAVAIAGPSPRRCSNALGIPSG